MVEVYTMHMSLNENNLIGVKRLLSAKKHLTYCYQFEQHRFWENA